MHTVQEFFLTSLHLASWGSGRRYCRLARHSRLILQCHFEVKLCLYFSPFPPKWLRASLILVAGPFRKSRDAKPQTRKKAHRDQ